jgi:hypothetical protein
MAEPTNVKTSFFLKILCNHVISGKLAPAELIISAMTGPNAMPFAIIICEIGIIVGNDLLFLPNEFGSVF